MAQVKPTAAQRKVLVMLGPEGRYCTHVAVYGYGFSLPVTASMVKSLMTGQWIEPIPQASRGVFRITDLGRAAIRKE